MVDRPQIWGLEGVGVRGGGPTWLCSGRVVWEDSGELSPPLLPPDAPGTCELGWCLGGGEGGPAGSQGLSYFCNPEHTCRSRREGQTLGAGLECRGPGSGGELWFHPSWQLSRPLHCSLGKVWYPEQRAWRGEGRWQ